MQFRIPVTEEILNLVASLDHFRGWWAGGSRIPSERAERIRREVALRSSVAACELAGIRISEADASSLLEGSTEPLQDGRELLGYSRALDWTFPVESLLLDTDLIRRLHAVVLGEEGTEIEPTPWRQNHSDHEAFDANGQALGLVFQTLPPRLVPETIEDLVTWLEYEMRSREHHPLLVIGTFLLALLTASPFERGNGRLASALAVHLLERAGYDHVRYASIERILAERRERFYEVLGRSQTRLWAGDADLRIWLTFFLDGLVLHSERVASLADTERRATEFSPLQRAILDTARKHGTVEAGLLLRTTGANRNTLKDNLRRLVDRGVLEKMGQRRGTRYRLKL
jgi:Fic family protein